MIIRGFSHNVEHRISWILLQLVSVGRDTEFECVITVLRWRAESIEFGDGFNDFLFAAHDKLMIHDIQGFIDIIERYILAQPSIEDVIDKIVLLIILWAQM